MKVTLLCNTLGIETHVFKIKDVEQYFLTVTLEHVDKLFPDSEVHVMLCLETIHMERERPKVQIPCKKGLN